MWSSSNGSELDFKTQPKQLHVGGDRDRSMRQLDVHTRVQLVRLPIYMGREYFFIQP